MLLHAPLYLLFLAGVAALYWRLPDARWRKTLLLAASYAFYTLFDYRFTLVLLGLTLADYTLGRAIERSRAAGSQSAVRYAWLSVAINLGALAFFKYSNFFLDSLAAWLGYWHIPVSGSSLDVLLPVGVSFYTFQGISYTTEIYRKKLAPAQDWMDFALYLAFFPKLIAGPLVKPASFLAQTGAPPACPTGQALRAALGLLLLGLVKKIVIADNLASMAEAALRAANLAAVSGFSGAQFPTPLFIQGFYLYAFYIYADFSGYTDIARASAALFGFQLPENFRQPYLSGTVNDFWNRWHMSLTQWFREYLFFPLSRLLLQRAGRRYPFLLQSAATLTTMLLIGLWHGAAWMFIAWGLWHGLLLALENVLKFKPARRWQSLLGGLVTFHLVGVGWVLFASASFAAAWEFLRGLFAMQQMAWLPYYLPSILAAALAVLAVDLAASDKLRLSERIPQPIRQAIIVAGITLVLSLIVLNLAHSQAPKPFVYGNF